MAKPRQISGINYTIRNRRNERANKSGVPSWVTPGALADGDFVNDRYWLDGRVVTVSEFLSYTRAGTAYDLGNNAGVINSYAANVIRKNDRGLLVEPAAENRWIRSNNPGDAAWTRNEVTAGAASGGFTQVLETVLSALHRLFRTSTVSLTTSQIYTFTWTMKKRGRRYVFIRISVDGGVTSRNVGFDLDTGLTTFVGSGLTATIDAVGNTFFFSVSATITSAFPTISLGVSNVAVTSDSVPANYAGDTAQGYDLFNFDVVLGSVKRSPFVTGAAVASRAVDAYSTTFVGAGSHPVTVIFDDDSYQIIPGVSAGAYAYPTNLDRPVIRRIIWGTINVAPETMMLMVSQTTDVNRVFGEGAPDVDWAYQGRLWNGNNPETRTRINPWGVIYRADGNPPPSDVAVEVGDLSLYVLYSGVWQRVTYNKRVSGAMYIATFEGYDTGTTPTTPATVYTGPGSFVIADVNIPDWAYHFFSPRVAITGTIQGIIVSYEARMISKTAQDISAYSGTLLAQVGCDYKDTDGTNIRDAFASSMIPITPNFQRFHGTTLSVSELQANPPPIALEMGVI